MIGRQLAAASWHPPNWIVTDRSALRVAVMLLIEYASRSFLWKWPVASYTVTDQNASTGTGSGIVSR